MMTIEIRRSGTAHVSRILQQGDADSYMLVNGVSNHPISPARVLNILSFYAQRSSYNINIRAQVSGEMDAALSETVAFDQ